MKLFQLKAHFSLHYFFYVILGNIREEIKREPWIKLCVHLRLAYKSIWLSLNRVCREKTLSLERENFFVSEKMIVRKSKLIKVK